VKKRVIIGAVILLVVLHAFRVYKVNSEIRAVKEVIIPFGGHIGILWHKDVAKLIVDKLEEN